LSQAGRQRREAKRLLQKERSRGRFHVRQAFRVSGHEKYLRFGWNSSARRLKIGPAQVGHEGRKSQAGAFADGRGGEGWLEDPCQGCFVHAGTGV